MRLKQKMFIGSAVLAALSVAITAYNVGIDAGEIGTEAMEAVAINHLTSVRDSKKQQIEAYFANVRNQLRFFSQNTANITAIQEFSQAFPLFQQQISRNEVSEDGPPETDNNALPLDKYKVALSNFYDTEYKAEFESLNAKPPPAKDTFLASLSPNAIALQYFYIAHNPNPIGTKEELDFSGDASKYSHTHKYYHPTLLRYIQQFNFEDILLIDATGNVVYSVLKQVDFATSLTHGLFADSALGRIFQQANQLTENDDVVLIDFSAYEASFNLQSAFIAAPIFNGNERMGVVVFRISIDPINDIMTYGRAWRIQESGRTGEAIIVAEDGTMRNDSRAMVQNKEQYLEKIENLNQLDAKITQEMDLKDTTVGLQKVDNSGVRNVFTGGVTGLDMIPDYKNETVISAYTPINVAGLNWAIFSNIAQDEATERVQHIIKGIRDAAVPIGLMVFIGGGLFGILYFGRVAGRVNILEKTVNKVNEGDFSARAHIKSHDELETLANAFNGLLDDRLTQLEKAEKENEMLNNSIIELLKASFQLSQRDLTVQVPVTEDVTGPLADAINQMASETSKVLVNVRKIADEVNKASSQVKTQADNVTLVAQTERQVVATTMTELEAASEAMNKIAEVAQSCNAIAAEASSTTEIALGTVTETIAGMGEIRETIHETEKRIKRLGERSQEISGIVELINNIAERTHVLALNASMQAAAAGEAGRGFSVVADEVQRLAENSRQATSQISALVKNIQVETNDTIATMDKTIGQVVDGSRLAERAGEQMRETQSTTGNLVEVVKQIATASQKQAQISNELREHALSIQVSTEETGRQLEQQNEQTSHLVNYAKQLIEAIHVFKLK